MRILFLTYSYLPNLGGVERSVYNLSRLFAGRGHSVTVVTHSGSAIPFRWRSAGLPPVLRLHIPSQTDPRLLVRLLRPGLNAFNLLLLTAFCRLQRIDVVHAHLLNMDTVYAGWLARLLGVPFVLTLRGGETEEWIHNGVRLRYLIHCLQEADFITAVCRSLLEQAVRLVPEIAGHAMVIPNPVDPGAITALADLSLVLPQSRPYLLFAGRLEAMKDLACLLDAYGLCVAADPGFPPDLVVIGEGSLAESLQRRCFAGPAAARIRFLGRLSQSDTLCWMRSALAIVLPSRCSEGCPNVVLEAMALGTPLVVSDLPSLCEWVDDRVTGLVFPVGQPEALAVALQELNDDPEGRARRAQVAMERLAMRFDMASVAQGYEAIYESLLRQQPTPQRDAAEG